MVSNSDRPGPAAGSFACWKDPRFRWIAFTLFALKIYLVAGQPIFAITPADMDDQLSVRLAEYILDGHWLGAYNEKTLVKGVAYSVFIALTMVLGIPLPIAQHLLYALAAWLVVRAVRNRLPNDVWALALFTLLLWNPMTFEAGTMSRVIRHHLLTPLAMLVFAGLFTLDTRSSARPLTRAAWAMLAGFAGGSVWLTREETFCFVPAVAMLIVAGIVFARHHGLKWLSASWPVPVAAAFAALPVATVATLNARYYGWFGTVEMRAPEYVGAIGALSRVIPPDGRIPNVPVNRSVREMAYEVSPAFLELKPYLEGTIGRSTSELSSMFTGVPVDRMEFLDGWGYFAVRQATHAAGYDHNAREALDLYARIAREVNNACDDGRLPAGPPRNTLRPIWQSTYTPRALRELLPFFSGFAYGKWGTFKTPDSIGNDDGLTRFRDITQWYTSRVNDQPAFTMVRTLRLGTLRTAVLAVIGKLAFIVGAIVMGIGVVAWAVTVVQSARKRHWPAYLWWAATATWGGAVAVVAVSFFMHITSFPISNPGYNAAAYPLAYLAAGLSLATLWRGPAFRSRV